MDDPFTLIERRLDKDGNGEGRMAVATKIMKSEDGKTIELENDGIAPVPLKHVRIQQIKIINPGLISVPSVERHARQAGKEIHVATSAQQTGGVTTWGTIRTFLKAGT